MTNDDNLDRLSGGETDAISGAARAARLREIAGRVEQGCIELRRAMSGKTDACPDCLKAAADLREWADELGPPVAGEHGATQATASLADRMELEPAGRTNV